MPRRKNMNERYNALIEQNRFHWSSPRRLIDQELRRSSYRNHI